MKFLLLCVALVTGVKCATATVDNVVNNCTVSQAALNELAELKILVGQLAMLVETIIAAPIPAEPPFVITEPRLDVSWNEVTLTWTPPEGVIGYTAEVISEGALSHVIRLSPIAESFSTTQIHTGVEYAIKITPIKGNGPGDAYTTDLFTPECPTFCIFLYAPVCGTDGNTYSNKCALEIAQCESEEDIEIASEGACDPCELIQCSVPICPPGYKLGDDLLPGECCLGCVDVCEGIQCQPPVCDTGYVVTHLEGDCCDSCEMQVFSDCGDAMDNGMTENGVYRIQPLGIDSAFSAYCDMETDGGKWTVMLRRPNSTVNFFRDYDEYVEGFGDVTGAFWIGLEKLYRLNKQGNTELLISAVDQRGSSAAAKYRIFRLGAAVDNYPLEAIAGFTEFVKGDTGILGNGMFFNKGAAFSARDQDNDLSTRDCAGELVGGWWYKGGMCSRTNPLGEYLQPDTRKYEAGVFWAPFRGKQHSLELLEMKVRNSA